MNRNGQQSSDQLPISSAQEFRPEAAPAPENQQSLSRRTLIKGGAVLGSGLAVTAGLAMTTAESSSSVAKAQGQTASGGQLREYWIQADSFWHNVVPTGYDGLMGMRYHPNETSYWAVGYRAYTPGWREPLAGNDEIGPNTGIPGPILRGKVGDTIRVHFRNNDTHYGYAHSMHPHGVSYTPQHDGGWFAADPRPGTIIKVGHSYTYEWQVRLNSVGTWVYHDHSLPQGPNMAMELGAQLGLFGFLVLTDASTKPVEREYFTFFHDLYVGDSSSLIQDFDCFNGSAYVGNTPTFTSRVGDRVRWHVGGLGTEFHVFHLHGHRWSYGGQWVDTILLGPSMATSFEFVEDNPGKWLYHCHVNDHMMGGMSGLYVVTE